MIYKNSEMELDIDSIHNAEELFSGYAFASWSFFTRKSGAKIMLFFKTTIFFEKKSSISGVLHYFECCFLIFRVAIERKIVFLRQI